MLHILSLRLKFFDHKSGIVRSRGGPEIRGHLKQLINTHFDKWRAADSVSCH